MPISGRQLLRPLLQVPLIDLAVLAGAPGGPHATVHREGRRVYRGR